MAVQAPALKLYQIVDELIELEGELMERDGVLDDELERRLDAMEGAFEEKVERICAFRQNLLRSAEAHEAEVERLKNRARTLKNSAESLRGYVFRQLVDAGRQKLQAGTWRLRIQRNPATVRPIDPNAIPEQYQRIRVEFDARKALADLKDAGYVPDLPGKAEVDGMVISRSAHLRIE